MSSSFGEIVTVPQIEQAILATLQKWSNTYLREIERRTGREPNAFPDVASWRPTDDILDRFPEQQIPSVQLQCTSEVDIETRAQDAVAGLRGTVDVLVQTNEAETAREVASLYVYHLALILVQNPELDGSVKCAGVVWEKMGVPDVGRLKDKSRWLAWGDATIFLAIEGFASPLMGPAEPIPADEEGTAPPEYPVAETHHLDVELEDDEDA
ncbi:MAG TPA: hypothetical protein VK756_07750 [Solirubrobacteraceae bacterium]|jgi:hypothetical protein|nr:hypothetical protein [Solirubrobacteraceae bacterium]